MVPVWLYAHDGRQLYYVLVPTPMPPAVQFNGESYAWSAANERYELIRPPLVSDPPVVERVK